MNFCKKFVVNFKEMNKKVFCLEWFEMLGIDQG